MPSLVSSQALASPPRSPLLWRILLGVALLLLLLPAWRGGATLLRPLSLADLVRRADRIVVVRVEGARCFWEQARIYTHTELEVLDILKGKLPEPKLVLRQLGGRVGEKEAHVSGTPRLLPGRQYLLFLDQDDQGLPYHYVVGFSQGVYLLEPATGELTRPRQAVVSFVEGAGPAAERYPLRAVRELLSGQDLSQ